MLKEKTAGCWELGVVFMKKTWVATACTAISILLMFTPSVPMVFGLSGGKTKIAYASYFSSLPIGYAVFMPAFSALLACVVLVLLANALHEKREAPGFASFCLSSSIIGHLLWWAFDFFRTIHPIGFVIVALHGCALLFLHWEALRKRFAKH